MATVIFVASQKALSAEVKAIIKQQLESVSNGWTVYRIARQASRMVCTTLKVRWWTILVLVKSENKKHFLVMDLKDVKRNDLAFNFSRKTMLYMLLLRIRVRGS